MAISLPRLRRVRRLIWHSSLTPRRRRKSRLRSRAPAGAPDFGRPSCAAKNMITACCGFFLDGHPTIRVLQPNSEERKFTAHRSGLHGLPPPPLVFLVPTSGAVPPHLELVDRRGSALAMAVVQVLACLPASVRVRPPCLSLHRSPLSFASSSVPRARLSPPLHAHVGFRRGWPPTQRDRPQIHGLASAVRGPVLRGFPCSRTASPAPSSRCLSTVSESRKPSGGARRPSTRSSSPCGRLASASVGRKSRPQLLLLVYSWSFSFMCSEKSGSHRPLFLT